jgi:hypothetical protein
VRFMGWAVPLAGHEESRTRMRMLDGFNGGRIDFQDDGREAIKGRTDAIAVIMALVAGWLGPLPRYRRNAKPNP